MVREYTLGQMEESMMEITNKIKSMVLELILGLMVNDILDNGETIRDMEEVIILRFR